MSNILAKLNNDLKDKTMGRTLNRRARTPNWSYEEKKYLLKLIKDRRALLFNNSSPNPFEDKSTAWTEILQALIVKYGNKFQGSTVKKIKTQWQNMKRLAREDVTQHGTSVHKYCEQTMEVCYILGLVVNEDSVVMDPHSTSASTCTDVIVKTERMDEDNDCEPCCSSTDNIDESEETSLNHETGHLESSSSSSVTHQQSETEGSDNTPGPSTSKIQNAAVIAEEPLPVNKENIDPVNINKNQLNNIQQLPVPPSKEPLIPKYSFLISDVEIVKADDPAPREVINLDNDDTTERCTNTSNEKEMEQTKPEILKENKRKAELQIAEVNNNEVNDDDDGDPDERQPNEKQIKLDIIKEERQVVRAMRETAELNKIIAEQRLKHILWMRKRDMMYVSGDPGSGAGKGGGGGGSIRDAGGAFGKQQFAREEEYFYKKQREQIADMKSHLDKEISFHKEQIKRHEDAIKRHQQQMDGIEKQ